MRKKLKFQYFLLFLILALTWACENEPNLENEVVQTDLQNEWLSKGEKLENPYSVKNMQQALQNLQKAQKLKSKTAKTTLDEFDYSQFEIEPTHLYVRFEPQTPEEEAVLKQDSTRVLFDYPLDYDFTDEVLAARPALQENQIPQYYAAIKINTEEDGFADDYDLLEELFIPEESDFFSEEAVAKSANGEAKTAFMEALIKEAFTLTGNADELQDNTTNNSQTSRLIFGTRWWPSGNIKIWDSNVNGGSYVPLEGAQVLIRQWFTVRQGITDQNGNFRTSSVRGRARYILQWERYHYSIRNGSLFQAEKRGENVINQPWNLNIRGGDDEYHGMIHTAAYDYYYGNRLGLISPPMNGHFYSFGRQGQIKIAARESDPWGIPSSYSHVRSELTFSLAPQIHIKAKGRSSDRVYGVTIHELSHALHSVLDRGSYDNIVRDAFLNNASSVKNRNRRLLETWPTTVEIMMTLNRYQTKFGNLNYEYRKVGSIFNSGNLQYVTISNENSYTSGGYDMIDHINQRSLFGSSYPIDRVDGYTLKQLQDALIGAGYWNAWKDNIKNQYNNPKEIYLDELFNNWQD